MILSRSVTLSLLYTCPVVFNHSKKDAVCEVVEIAVIILIFFAIPIEPPVGVSDVQKYPYCDGCNLRGPVNFILVSKSKMTRRQCDMKSV